MDKLKNIAASLLAPLLTESLLKAIMSNFHWYRSMVGGCWGHYYMEDGRIEIWHYIRSNESTVTNLPVVYYALSFEHHPYKFTHTKSGVSLA